MNVFVDENIPNVTVETLRELGHDVLDFRGTDDEGTDDLDLWPLVQSQGRLLISNDKGFTARRHESHHGMILVRLRQPNSAKIHDRVMRAFTAFLEEEWPGLLVVMRDSVQSVSRSP